MRVTYHFYRDKIVDICTCFDFLLSSVSERFRSVNWPFLSRIPTNSSSLGIKSSANAPPRSSLNRRWPSHLVVFCCFLHQFTAGQISACCCRCLASVGLYAWHTLPRKQSLASKLSRTTAATYNSRHICCAKLQQPFGTGLSHTVPTDRPAIRISGQIYPKLRFKCRW